MTTRERFPLHLRIFVGLAIGVVVGLLINRFWTPDVWASLSVNNPKAYLAGTAVPENDNASILAGAARLIASTTDFLGKIFVRALRFIAVPIVLFSIIVAVAGLGDPRKLGRLGAKTLGIFALTVLIAVVVASTLATTIRPGDGVDQSTRERLLADASVAGAKTLSGTTAASATSFKDQLLNVLTLNPFDSLARGDMLQVVVTAIILGFGLTLIPKDRAKPVIDACDAITSAILELVRLLLRFAPIAVLCLITPVIATLGVDALTALIMYCLAVLLGMAIILFIEYPAVLWFFTRWAHAGTQRVGVVRFFRAMAPAQLLAFGSSSSAATLPVTIECCEERLGVPKDIASFVCPLGTTINMDGTALFQVISVNFLAQLYAVDLSFTDQLTIAALSVLVAIGAPGLPSASVVMMVVPLQAVGVPIEGLALVLAVDRLLDMARTVVNVSGDAVAAVVVAASEGRMTDPPTGGESKSS
jgi:proton glutamate symport protein